LFYRPLLFQTTKIQTFESNSQHKRQTAQTIPEIVAGDGGFKKEFPREPTGKGGIYEAFVHCFS